MNNISENSKSLLHEFGTKNPVISYFNDKQSYIGIVDCFVSDENKLRIYFKWLIWSVNVGNKSLSQKIYIRSKAIIENPIIEKCADILKIKHRDGEITVTNLGSEKFMAIQLKIQYEKSNHH